MRAIVLLTCAMLVFGEGAQGQQRPQLPKILYGKCSPQSMIGTGAADENLDETATPFRCDTAIIARPGPGRFMITFLKRGGDREDMVGFAGTIARGGNRMNVSRVYVGSLPALPVNSGLCEMRYNRFGKPDFLTCGARAERFGDAIGVAIQLIQIRERQ